MSDINIYFVLPANCEDELSTTEEMQAAFEACRTNGKLPEWLREENLLDQEFIKKDVVVFDKFEGDVFDKLKIKENNKCLSIVGPRCLLTAVTEGVSIPNNGSPIYTMAMADMKIALSSFPPNKKKQLREKIELMGGIFSIHITNSVRYLISLGVRSQKYVMAINNNIKVMSEEWVNAVWEEGLKRMIKASDPEFIDKYKLPPFDQLNFTSTGFDDQERNGLQKLIEDNGGNFSGRMSVKNTHMVICKSGIKSNKFIVAQKNKIPCVGAEWVYDCVQAGVALKEDNYLIRISSSTPTKNVKTPNLNFSQLSAISGPGMDCLDHVTSLNTTNMSIYQHQTTLNETGVKSAVKQTNDIKENVEDSINGISINDVKTAGPFLDGCGIYLAGFSAKSREKLCRILRIGGATRYDDISDRITQILVGDKNSPELKLCVSKNCHAPLVSIDWLQESIRLKLPANEENYIVSVKASPSALTPASPLVKKGLHLLRSNTSSSNLTKEKFVKRIDFDDDDDDPNKSIMKQYLTKTNEEEDTLAKLIAQGNFEDTDKRKTEKDEQEIRAERSLKTTVALESTSTLNEDSIIPIFQDKGFVLTGLEEEQLETLTMTIEERCGIVKSPKFTGIPDYVITPVFINNVKLNATEIYNYLWVEECHRENDIVSPKYYHHPIFNNNTTGPLKNCVVTISNYLKSERNFLREVLIHLGASYQDQFSKVQTKNVKRNTHLICYNKSGKKYNAAVDWGVPVVTHKWLMDCLKNDTQSNERSFTIDLLNKTEEEVKIIHIPESCIKKNVNTVESTITSASKSNFPSMCKQRMNKLDVSITKRDEEKENKRKLEVNESGEFSGFQRKSIEKSILLSQGNKLKNEHELLNAHTSTPNKEIPTCDATGTASTVVEKGECYIDIDGEQVLLSNFMQDLRDKGVFDPGSPVDKYNVSPYVVPQDIKNIGKPHTPKLNDSIQPSQDTPVGKYIKGLQKRIGLPSESPKSATPDSPMPRSVFDVSTPEAPLGAFTGNENPSPNTRKYWQRRIDRIPHYSVHDRPPVNRRLSTPMSEVKKQVWAKLLNEEYKPKRDESPTTSDLESANKKPRLCFNSKFDDDDDDDSDEAYKAPVTASQIAEDNQIKNQVKQIQHMLKNIDSSGGRRSSIKLDNQKKSLSHVQISLFHQKESQPDSVTWVDPIDPLDDTEDHQDNQEKVKEEPIRKFMLSTIDADQKKYFEQIIVDLGGTLSESNNFEYGITHLVCQSLSRNEKVLASIASGKYIVHTSYLTESKKAGKFLEEECYEYGSPKMLSNIADVKSTNLNQKVVHWWRNKINEDKKGAFHNWRVLIFHRSKEQMQRLVEAGGGVVVNSTMPFTHNIDATHCLLETKEKVKLSDFLPLVKQGVPCLNILYLNAYLNSLGKVDIKDYIIPDFKEHYNN